MSAVTLGSSGRAVPSVGCAVAFAMSLLSKEQAEREIVVFEDGRAVAVCSTKGDGVAVVRRGDE